MDTDSINAFATPGGYMFITRGMLVRMHDESELAGVLAHEISTSSPSMHLKLCAKTILRPW